jgi:hypothetical protein
MFNTASQKREKSDVAGAGATQNGMVLAADPSSNAVG